MFIYIYIYACNALVLPRMMIIQNACWWQSLSPGQNQGICPYIYIYTYAFQRNITYHPLPRHFWRWYSSSRAGIMWDMLAPWRVVYIYIRIHTYYVNGMWFYGYDLLNCCSWYVVDNEDCINDVFLQQILRAPDSIHLPSIMWRNLSPILIKSFRPYSYSGHGFPIGRQMWFTNLGD